MLLFASPGFGESADGVCCCGLMLWGGVSLLFSLIGMARNSEPNIVLGVVSAGMQGLVALCVYATMNPDDGPATRSLADAILQWSLVPPCAAVASVLLHIRGSRKWTSFDGLHSLAGTVAMGFVVSLGCAAIMSAVLGDFSTWTFARCWIGSACAVTLLVWCHDSTLPSDDMPP